MVSLDYFYNLPLVNPNFVWWGSPVKIESSTSYSVCIDWDRLDFVSLCVVWYGFVLCFELKSDMVIGKSWFTVCDIVRFCESFLCIGNKT